MPCVLKTWNEKECSAFWTDPQFPAPKSSDTRWRFWICFSVDTVTSDLIVYSFICLLHAKILARRWPNYENLPITKKVFLNCIDWLKLSADLIKRCLFHRSFWIPSIWNICIKKSECKHKNYFIDFISLLLHTTLYQKYQQKHWTQELVSWLIFKDSKILVHHLNCPNLEY